MARRKLTALDDPLAASEPGNGPKSGVDAPRSADPRSETQEVSALFVRIPTAQADALARAAFELRLHKQEVIAALLAAYVDARSDEGLAKVRELVSSYRDGAAS